MTRWMCVGVLWLSVVVAGLACGPSTNVKRDSFLNATVTTVQMGALDQDGIALRRLGVRTAVDIIKHDSGKKTYKAKLIFSSSLEGGASTECDPTYMIKPPGGADPVTLACTNPDPKTDQVKKARRMGGTVTELRECPLNATQIKWFAKAGVRIRATCAGENPYDYAIPAAGASELSAALSGRKRK